MGARPGISGEELEYNGEISRRIEQLRKRQGIPGAELARAAGVDSTALYNYEAGRVRWPVFRLRLIADYLGVPVERIMPKTIHNYQSPGGPQELF